MRGLEYDQATLVAMKRVQSILKRVDMDQYTNRLLEAIRLLATLPQSKRIVRAMDLLHEELDEMEVIMSGDENLANRILSQRTK